MKFSPLALALLSLPALAANPGDHALENTVIGGQQVPGTSRFARTTVEFVMYQGATADDGAGLCSGTLIGKDIVVTAAHCVINEATGLPMDHIVAIFNPTANNISPQDILGGATAHTVKVASWKAHPGYKNVNDGVFGSGINRPIHDVAVVKLESPAPAADSLVASLPTAEVTGNEDLVLAGYGRTDASDPTSVGSLYFAWTSGTAIGVGFGADHDTQIRMEGIQPCNGDSGGPIFRADEQRIILQGVTSNVMNSCGVNGTAMSVFSHLSWIRQTAAQLGGSIGR